MHNRSLAPAAASPDAFTQVKRLGQGVNILGYDPIWDDARDARLKDTHFKLIRDAGFKLDGAWLCTLGWAWAYWRFDSDFIVYDIDRDGWVGPILKALIPDR